jgi:hypothetical protein
MSLVKPDRDDLAAWVIGPYLAVHVMFFVYVWVLFWIETNPAQAIPVHLGLLTAELPKESFESFRQLVLAACSAGIGGAVFMIREFYISYAYGKEKKEKEKRTTAEDKKGEEKEAEEREFLKNREIPRYVLLPLSSVILGPIAIFLLQAGAIVFAGVTAQGKIPDYTVVAVAFFFGFY